MDLGLPDVAACPTLTYFELATLLAAIVFERRRVRWATFEVGLGGRLDATNALSPSVTAITSLGIDHERWLGNDLESIAREKAGIVRRDVPLVIGSRKCTSYLCDHAERIGAPRYVLDEDFRVTGGPAEERFEGFGRSIDLVGVGTAPEHHRDNLATAISVSLLASDIGGLPPLADETIAEGVRRARWPGRFWFVPRSYTRDLDERRVLLDAAHNPSGAKALVGALANLSPARIALVVNTAQDKDAASIMAELCQIPGLCEVVVPPLRSERMFSPQGFCDASALEHTCTRSTLREAFERAVDAVGRQGIVVVAGSIYLLGEVMEMLDCSKELESLFGR